MKEKLLKLLKTKEEARAALVAKSEKSEDVTELRSIQAQIESINTEMAELRGMLAEIDAAEARAAAGAAGEGDEARTAAVNAARGQQPPAFTPGRGFVPAPGGQPGPLDQRAKEDDPLSTIEYRKAFMDFCKTGRMASVLQKAEMRTDAMTATTDVSAVIPSTIMNEVIKKVTVYGQVYARCRKVAIKGGVTVPILSLKPTASWISESVPSSKQKVQANTSVSFSYFGLECKVSTSLLADTVTLTGFETIIVDLIVEAMVKAIEISVITGAGTASMLGITIDSRVPAAQIVTLSSADFQTWDAWKKKVFAKMPLAYKAGASFFMASGTFEGYIDGMVDANGQPIGRINYGITEGPQERFGGKAVIQVEDDIIANYDDASTGDVVAIYCNLTNYAINSNMQMTMFRYLDHDTNEWVDKAILIADGKLLDPNGVVIVKKGA